MQFSDTSLPLFPAALGVALLNGAEKGTNESMQRPKERPVHFRVPEKNLLVTTPHQQQS